MQIAYRAKQFWKALQARPTPAQLAEARTILSPELMGLFLTMQPGEQAHSLNILKELDEQGHHEPDLQAAALLHDVGKARHPLRIWERIEIVLTQALLPGRVERWGQGEPIGWKRPFVIAAQHPAWGAEMAAAAGASPMTIQLIRRHQAKLPEPLEISQSTPPEEHFLLCLQMFDDLN